MKVLENSSSKEKLDQPQSSPKKSINRNLSNPDLKHEHENQPQAVVK